MVKLDEPQYRRVPRIVEMGDLLVACGSIGQGVLDQSLVPIAKKSASAARRVGGERGHPAPRSSPPRAAASGGAVRRDVSAGEPPARAPRAPGGSLRRSRSSAAGCAAARRMMPATSPRAAGSNSRRCCSERRIARRPRAGLAGSAMCARSAAARSCRRRGRRCAPSPPALHAPHQRRKDRVLLVFARQIVAVHVEKLGAHEAQAHRTIGQCMRQFDGQFRDWHRA